MREERWVDFRLGGFVLRTFTRDDGLTTTNPCEALMREYPPILRNAGIRGTVVVWFFVSEEGQVLDRRVPQSSGHTQLDEAALQVADVFQIFAGSEPGKYRPGLDSASDYFPGPVATVAVAGMVRLRHPRPTAT